MNFFRNPEIQKELWLHIILTILFVLIGFFHMDISIWFVLAVCITLTTVHLFFQSVRYRNIRQLSSDIEHILHHTDNIRFSDYCEGELSILKVEIQKILKRLQEQSEALHNDKIILADSLADISHQIRTPLTSIHLILALLSEPNLSVEKRFQLIRQLSVLVSRIDWLIEALLKIAKLDAETVTLKLEKVSVEEVILQAQKSLEIPMELREQQFSFCSQTTPIYFDVDVSWTVEAIGNILKNCMEHTPFGGEIKVSVSENAIFTQIIIEDNGSGFAKEDIPHLFERFYKGKNSNTESIGIGLALARMILSKENASVTAENKSSNNIKNTANPICDNTKQSGARFKLRFYKDTTF